MFPSEAIFHRLSPGLYGLVGGAGSGKTTLKRELEINDIAMISVDDFFIGDSQYRIGMLSEKYHHNSDAYLDAINQSNWWDWNALITAIRNADPSIVTIVEGAILGPSFIVNLFRSIFVFNPHPSIRMSRILERDKNKRTVSQMCARFLITEYAEGIYYDWLFRQPLDLRFIVNERQSQSIFVPMEIK